MGIIPFPRRRSIVTLAFLASICFLVLLASFGSSKQQKQYDLPWGMGSVVADREGIHQEQRCPPQLEHLRKKEYHLTRKIKYQKICVQPELSDDVDVNTVEHITEAPQVGLEAQHSLSLSNKCRADDPKIDSTRCTVLKLRVPKPYITADYSDVAFAVATGTDRLEESLPHFKHWLGGTNAVLIAMVQDHGVLQTSLASLVKKFRDVGVNLMTLEPDKTVGVNAQHFTIIREVLKSTKSTRKWISVIDDDTFFPSLYPVRKMLDKYDPTKPVYIGAISENTHNVNYHGHMGFGGAGVFISRALASKLEPHIEECLAATKIREGDALLAQCIKAKTDVKLSEEPRLHQIDMSHDLGGFFEGGLQPMSLHHWKSWFSAPVAQMAKITKMCGSCFLQRWRLGNNLVFTNGYSIASYADGTEKLNLSQVEATWNDADKRKLYLKRFGELRDKLSSSKKKSYLLIDSERVGEQVRQVYVYRKVGSATRQEDEVVELWWEKPKSQK